MYIFGIRGMSRVSGWACSIWMQCMGIEEFTLVSQHSEGGFSSVLIVSQPLKAIASPSDLKCVGHRDERMGNRKERAEKGREWKGQWWIRGDMGSHPTGSQTLRHCLRFSDFPFIAHHGKRAGHLTEHSPSDPEDPSFDAFQIQLV